MFKKLAAINFRVSDFLILVVIASTLTVMPLLSLCSVNRQKTKYSDGYIPLKKFKGDTIAYVLRNFHDHKQRYLGKKMEVFFNDLELPIKSNLCVPEFDSFAHHMAISYLPRQEFDRKIEKKDYPRMIYIEFNEPIPWPILKREVSSKEQGRWSNVSREFFGKLTMKDIDLISYLKAEKEAKGRQKVQKPRSPKSQ